MVDYVSEAENFCSVARRMLNLSPDEDFTTIHMMGGYAPKGSIFPIDEFGIYAVINNISKSHWRLVLDMGSNLESLLLYDPFFEREGSHIFWEQALNDKTEYQTFWTIPLRNYYIQQGFLSQAKGRELIGTGRTHEKNRRKFIRNQGYKLNLPNEFKHLELQSGAHNCGPAVLYAGLVANRYTPKFKDRVKTSLVKKWGIIIE